MSALIKWMNIKTKEMNLGKTFGHYDTCNALKWKCTAYNHQLLHNTFNLLAMNRSKRYNIAFV